MLDQYLGAVKLTHKANHLRERHQQSEGGKRLRGSGSSEGFKCWSLVIQKVKSLPAIHTAVWSPPWADYQNLGGMESDIFFFFLSFPDESDVWSEL